MEFASMFCFVFSQDPCGGVGCGTYVASHAETQPVGAGGDVGEPGVVDTGQGPLQGSFVLGPVCGKPVQVPGEAVIVRHADQAVEMVGIADGVIEGFAGVWKTAVGLLHCKE